MLNRTLRNPVVSFIHDTVIFCAKLLNEAPHFMPCYSDALLEHLHNAGDLAEMMATLSSYDRLFGPSNMRTLSVAALLGENLAKCGETELARNLLNRVVRDVGRTAGPAHPLRIRALDSLRELHIRRGDLESAVAVQTELAACRRTLAGPDDPQTLEAKSRLGSLLMQMTTAPAA